MPTIDEMLGLGRLSAPARRFAVDFGQDDEDEPPPFRIPRPVAPLRTTMVQNAPPPASAPIKYSILDSDEDGTFQEALAQRLKTMPREDIESNPSGALQYALDILDLPRNIVANLVNAGIEGASGSETPVASKERAFGMRRISAGDLLRRAGLSVGDHEIPGGGIADFLTGFIGDVALDPLTYLTFGTSGLVGSAGKKVGKQILRPAGVEQARKLAEPLTERILATRAAARAAETAAETPLGRAFETHTARQDALAKAANLVAEGAPELVDRNAIGITTRGLKNFGPLDLPVALTQGVTSVVNPRAGEALAKAWDKIGPYQRLFAKLPDADLTLLTRDQLAALPQRLGLDRLGAAAQKIPGVQPVLNAVKNAAAATGETLHRAFSTEPLPPRDASPTEAARYEGERLQRFAESEIGRRMRTVAYDEPRPMRERLDAAAQLSGLPRAAVDEIVFDLAERLPATDKLEDAAKSAAAIAQRHGGTEEQAAQLVRWMNDEQFGPPAQGNAPPPTPNLQSKIQNQKSKIASADPLRQVFQTARPAIDPQKTADLDGLVKAALDGAAGKKLTASDVKHRIAQAVTWARLQDLLSADAPARSAAGTLAIEDAMRRVTGYDALAKTAAAGQAAGLERSRIAAKYATDYKHLSAKRRKALLAMDVEYQTAQAKYRSAAGQEKTAGTRELEARAYYSAAQGDLSPETVTYAPLHVLPRPVRDAVQTQAKYLLESLPARGNDSRRTVLEKIIEDAGADQGPGVAAEKASILDQLAGGKGTGTRETAGGYRPPNYLGGQADPLITTIMEADDARRGTLIDDAIHSLGGPDETELADHTRRYLAYAAGLDNADPVKPKDIEEFLELWRKQTKAHPADVVPPEPRPLSELQAPPPDPLGQTDITGDSTPQLGPVPEALQGSLTFPRSDGPGRLEIADPIREITDLVNQRASQRPVEADQYGVPSKELTTKRGVGYLTRLLAGDPRQRLWQLFRRGGMTLSSKFNTAREAWAREKFTVEANQEIDALNDWLKTDIRPSTPEEYELQRSAEKIGARQGDVIAKFGTDPVLAHAYREIDHARTIGSAEFFTELANRFGTRVPKGAKPPPGKATIGRTGQFGKVLDDVAFEPAVAHIIEKHVRQWAEPSKLLGAVRAVNNLWKGWVLVAPAYHTRNLWGNVWNSMLLDGWDADAFNAARRLQRAAAGLPGAPQMSEQIRLPAKEGRRAIGYTYAELHRALTVDHSVIGGGLFGAVGPRSADDLQEVLEAIDKPASAKRAWERLREGRPLKANQALGQLGEEAGRVSMVIARLSKGDSLEEAVARTKTALFDYGDLTEFERGGPDRPGLRDVMPFLAWTKNNAKLLALMIATNPAKLAQVPKIQLAAESALAGDSTLPPSMRPGHVLKEGGIQLSGGANPRFLNAGYMLPIGELGYNPLTPGQAAGKVLEQMGGPLRTAAELITNRDTYFNRPIVEYPGQEKEFLGVNMDPRLKHVLRTLRPLNVAEQLSTAATEADSPLQGAATAAAQAVGLRTFGVDASRQVYEQERTLNTQLGAIRRDMKRRITAITQGGGDPAGDPELQRLLQIHEQTKAQRDQLPRGAARAVSRPLSKRRQQLLEQYMEQQQPPAAPQLSPRRQAILDEHRARLAG